jgi:hypothetical protein
MGTATGEYLPGEFVEDDDLSHYCNREEGMCLVVIDEEGVDNDFWFLERAADEIGGWTPGELINDEENPFWSKVPTEVGNPLFPWNILVEMGAVPPGSPIDNPPGGDLVLFPTGQVDDEGWYNLPEEIYYADGHARPYCRPYASSHQDWVLP